MIHLNSRAYLTICLRSYEHAQKTNIELLGLPSTSLSWIMTPEIHPGQLIIIVNETTLYTIDSQCRPFQITGTRDLLLDTRTYIDLIENYQNVLSDLQSILRQIFLSLSLQEMSSCEYLVNWEWKIKEEAIANKMSFNEIKAFCFNSLNDLPNKDLSLKLKKALNEVKKSRKKSFEPHIDWGDYNITNQKLTPAND